MPEMVGMRGSSQPLTSPSFDELHELALAHHGVGEVQAREFVLMRQRRAADRATRESNRRAGDELRTPACKPNA